MWQVKKVARPRRMSQPPAGRNRAWLLAALIPAIVLGLGACSSKPAPPQPQVITDKGTPYGDLLVPKLTASVKDGAVGVSVESPVTVSAEDGVLGAVTMVNEDGGPSPGQLQPGRPDVVHDRAAGLQQALHAERAVARPRRCHQPADDVRDAFAGKPDHALRAAQRRRGRRRRPAGRGPVRREHPEPVGGREGDQGHHQPAGGGRLLLAEQSRSALAPSRNTGSRARPSTSR